MTNLPSVLGAGYSTGSSFTADEEDTVETAVNRLTAALSNTGLLKSTGSAVIAAVSGTDYMRPFWVNVLDHGADPTGVADSTAAFNAAKAALAAAGYTYPDLPSGGGWVYAPTGNYKISSTLQFTEFQGLRGDGAALTILNYTGTGPCINATNTNTPTGWPAPCGFEGFCIDGSANANSGCGGLQMSNLDNSHVNDIQIQNFYQSGSIGLYLYNYATGPSVETKASERSRFTRISLRNNTNAVVFSGDTSTAGQGAFNYSVYEFELFCSTNQNGITFQNFAAMGGSRLSIVGNFSTGGSSNTGWVLALDPGNTAGTSGIYACELNIIVETDGPASSLGHKTIVLGSQSLGGINATGIVWFVPPVPGYSVWQGLETPAYGYTLALSGFISEPVLGEMTYNDCMNFQGGTQWGVFNNGGAAISTGYTIRPQYGDVQQLTLPNTACTIAGFLSAPYTSARKLDLFFVQPASGATCVMTWPGNVHIMGSLSTVNSAVDLVRLTYLPASNAWYGQVLSQEAQLFTRVAVTTTYTASPWQSVECNATSAPFTVTLPTAPADGTVESVKKTDSSTNVVTWHCGGSDVINVSGGSTSGTLAYQYQGVLLEYDSPSAIWTIIGDDLPLSDILSATGTITNKIISGSSNTFSNIPLSGLASAAYSSSTVTPSTLAERDTAGALYANNYITTPYIQAASATTLALGANSAGVIVITGTTQNQIITLPPAANIWESWKILNNTSGANVTVNGYSSGTADVLTPGESAVFTALSTSPTTAANWRVDSGFAIPSAGIIKSTGSAITDAVAGTDYVAPGGPLGTPSSAVLTNCTGLPIGGLTAGVQALLNVGFLPTDNGYGWKYWSFDPINAYTGAIPAGGFANFTLLEPVRSNDTITNVLLDVQTAGATLTSGECFAALFTAAGALLSTTADQSTNWQSTGLKTMALSAAQAVTPGLYYVGFFWNGTTGPKFSTSGVQAASNGANSGTYPRFGIDVGHTGLTTAFPSTASVSAAASGYWAGAS